MILKVQSSPDDKPTPEWSWYDGIAELDREPSVRVNSKGDLENDPHLTNHKRYHIGHVPDGKSVLVAHLVATKQNGEMFEVLVRYRAYLLSDAGHTVDKIDNVAAGEWEIAASPTDSVTVNS